MSLPKPPAEVPRETRLELLAPRYRARLDQVLMRMIAAGHSPIIAETLRTPERQRFLYGFGRWYDDGRGIVTYSEDWDETWHGFGLAADIWDKHTLWNASDAFWDALGEACRFYGLTWGGDWNGNALPDERFSDRPHTQWGSPMRRSPSPRAARLFRQGGFEAVWREVGAVA